MFSVSRCVVVTSLLANAVMAVVISVTNLDQLECIRESLTPSEEAELAPKNAKEAGGTLGKGGDHKSKTEDSRRTRGTLIVNANPKAATKDELTLDGGYVETSMNEVSIISNVDDPPGLRLGVKREKGWGRSLGKFSFNSVRPDRVQDECVLIQGKLDERFPLTHLVGEYIFFLRTPPG